MKEVYVITEMDKYGQSIIGVSSSPKKSKKIIKKYYGNKAKIVKTRDIRDSGIEYEMDIIDEEGSACRITVEYFTFNEL
jgi:hypothetical protein